MKKTVLAATAVMSFFLVACNNSSTTVPAASAPASAPVASEASASAPEASEAVSASAEVPAEGSASDAKAGDAATTVDALSKVCKDAIAEEEKYIGTLSGTEKTERQKEFEEWRKSLLMADSRADQDENCKTALEDNKEDAKEDTKEK